MVLPETISQRIVRAKRKLRELNVKFDTLQENEFSPRLHSVISVIYLLFTEGYSPTHGKYWVNPGLCDDAIRLGRMLAALLPKEAEIYGLVALMELQASRIPARTANNGHPVLLRDQNRSKWDHLLIQHGLKTLSMSIDLYKKRGKNPGPITLQAAIAACHARSFSVEKTDWQQIISLYDELFTISKSPVIAINRSIAVSMRDGPQAGLNQLKPLFDDKNLKNYHLFFSVSGDFQFQLGNFKEARLAFEHAISLVQNKMEKEILQTKLMNAKKAENKG